MRGSLVVKSSEPLTNLLQEKQMGSRNKDENAKSLMNITRTIVLARRNVVEDIPSDISADEWGEINRYGHILAREAQEKEKNDHRSKQMQVKQALDQQVLLQRELKEKRTNEIKELDSFML